MGYVFSSRQLKARLILQNPDDVAWFEQAGLVDSARICLIRGSGVDCTRFIPREPSGTRNALRVLLVARVLWDKGVGEYVQAARVLRAGGCTTRFLLVGTSDPGNPEAVPGTILHTWADEGVIECLAR